MTGQARRVAPDSEKRFRTMRTGASAAITVMIAAVLHGCVSYTEPVKRSGQMTPAQRNFEAAWQGSQDALRDYGFTLDRQDRRAGVITTKPLLARHWFEFWRRDAGSSREVLEGTVQTVHRTASVRIVRTAPEAENYRVSVEVVVSRSSGTRMVGRSASDAYEMFVLPGGEDHSHKPMLGYAMMGPTTPVMDPNTVVASGQDRSLADRIAAEISRAASRRLLEGLN